MAILTIQLFNQYCDDYFLANQNKTNILNGAIKNRLPVIITNTETALNAMLNGRLYKTYPSNGNITFKGVGQLSAQDEQTTLYSALTEAVLYKIQTGAFVNLKNNYNGNITGSNNFDTSNSNVIGLRNDIRDKLVMLQLYKSATFNNPTVEATIQSQQNQTLTVQQSTQISNWLSTNNFTLGGSWNFANLNVDGTPINQYISNQLSSVDKGMSTVLINYLPSTEIPLITSKDIAKWNNTQTVNLDPINQSINTLTSQMNTFISYVPDALQNYAPGPGQTSGTIIPLITSIDVSNWNDMSKDFIKIIPQIAIALANYNGEHGYHEIPLITSTDISNWNTTMNVSTILSNYINIPNQTQQALVPYITQADIDKWNSNSGSTSTGSSVSIKEQTFTLTISNTWQVQYGNGALAYQGSTLSVSPALPNGLSINVSNVNNSIGSGEPYIVISVSGKTILNSLVIPYTLPANNNSYMISSIESTNLKVIDNISYSITASIEYGSWQSNLGVFNVWAYWGVYQGATNTPQPLDENNSFCLYLNYTVGTSGTLPNTSETQNINENMLLSLKLTYIE